jgi:2-oxoglutarate ferredoxin oxidoreductase subunit beta
MTGGQMAPTSMLGQKTTTSPAGRESLLDGHPIQISEVFSLLPGTTYIERCTVNTPANILKTKKSIRKAFQYQIDRRGFSLVEILSACPTNWKMTPLESSRWIDEVMSKKFPLGVMKDLPAGETKKGEKRHDG